MTCNTITLSPSHFLTYLNLFLGSHYTFPRPVPLGVLAARLTPFLKDLLEPNYPRTLLRLTSEAEVCEMSFYMLIMLVYL